MAIVKAILLEPVKKLGKAGDIVDIPRGFFRYLENLHKARYATRESINQLEHEFEALKLKDEERKKVAMELSQKLQGYTLKLVREASETGILYGSVSARDIASELLGQAFDVHYRQVFLEAPIKELGKYEISLELHPQVILQIPLEIKQL